MKQVRFFGGVLAAALVCLCSLIFADETALSSIPMASSNPFLNRTFYVNPTYQQELNSSISTCFPPTCSVQTKATLNAMTHVPSAYWLDTMSKISGNTTRSLEGILASAASMSPAPLVVFIVYDLPNRDCHAKASNGEICCYANSDGTCNYNQGGDCSQGIATYKNNYIDPIVSLFARYQNKVPIVAIIEPDSLPNLATNQADPHCGNSATQTAYMQGITYAVTQIATQAPQVTQYIDAAHGGWLGWPNNIAAFVQIIQKLGIVPQYAASVRGFSNNVANYQPLGTVACPSTQWCLNGQNPTDPCCTDPCHLLSQYNPANSELNYVLEMRTAFQQATNGQWVPQFVTDTGRNGVTNERSDCANWCNIRNAGIGFTPRTNTAIDGIDAYYWLKTPGESDGCTQVLPNGSQCPRYDSSCDSVDSIGSLPSEPRAPQAGQWFDYEIKQLASNAKMN